MDESTMRGPKRSRSSAPRGRSVLLASAGPLLASALLLLASAEPVQARDDARAAAAPPAAAPACGPKALGTHRVVTIDTKGGPSFGKVQYGHNDFLAPGEVVLTFDDGPHRAYTRPILDALAAHCARATFFMVGRMAIAFPEMVREVARRGHTVGTHTWSHNYHLGRANMARVRDEVELGISAVERALGAPVAPFFRFPFLSDSKAAIAHLMARDHGIFSIDVDSRDFRFRGAGGAAGVIRTVLAGLASRGKGILLFHDIQPSTARALPTLLTELQARGYKVVHIVPKGRASSFPEYDKRLEQLAGRHLAALGARPLADRAVTWPMSVGRDPASPSALPWQTNAPARPDTKVDAPARPLQVPAAVAPAPEPPLRGRLDEDWRTRVFGQ
jgi:peptidoglycan/xylan/chitin deacetylase (PgdA/CDA1 family)